MAGGKSRKRQAAQKRGKQVKQAEKLADVASSEDTMGEAHDNKENMTVPANGCSAQPEVAKESDAAVAKEEGAVSEQPEQNGQKAQNGKRKRRKPCAEDDEEKTDVNVQTFSNEQDKKVPQELLADVRSLYNLMKKNKDELGCGAADGPLHGLR